MSLVSRLETDLKAALRAQDEMRKTTIRLLLAALKNQQIENRAPLDPQQELGVLQREAKRRRETAEEYRRLDRPDMAEKELAEYAVMEAYLPQQLSEADVRAIVMQAVQETGATSPREMGRVMSAVLPRLRGQADGKLVSQIVRETLAAQG